MRLIGNVFVPHMFNDLEVTFWLGRDDSSRSEDNDRASEDTVEPDPLLVPYLKEVSA
jgi:hypothetical protein